jgi:hypothetical protein
VDAIIGDAHDRDDLLDPRRIGPVATTVVVRGAPAEVPPAASPGSDGDRRVEVLDGHRNLLTD